MKQKKLLLYRRSKRILQAALLCLGTAFTSGCETSHHVINLNDMVIKSLPEFPAPSLQAIDELERVCPYDKDKDGLLPKKCKAIYEWLDRLNKYEKQMMEYANK